METNNNEPVESPDASQSQPATATRCKNKVPNSESGSELSNGCVVALAIGISLFLAVMLEFLGGDKARQADRERKANETETAKEKSHLEAQAANPKGKLTAFKAVVAQFKQFPDRFTPDSQRTAYNEELGKLVQGFTQYPFDARANPSVARSIVELFEAKIQGNYSGYQYNLVDECVRNIYSDSLNR